MGKHSPPVPQPSASVPDDRDDGRPRHDAAAPHRATDRTMAAAAAAAAATAAVAALPPMTSPTPASGRRARRDQGNPYGPGGPENAVTGQLPAASLFTPERAPQPAAPQPAAQPPAAPSAGARGRPRRATAPAPWDEPVTPQAAPPPTAPQAQVVQPASRLLQPDPAPAVHRPAPAPERDVSSLLAAPSRAPHDTGAAGDPAAPGSLDLGFPELAHSAPPRPRKDSKAARPPAPPQRPTTSKPQGAPGRRPRRIAVAAAAVAVVGLATTAAVAADRWPLGGSGDSGVSLSANRTKPTPAPSAAPSATSGAPAPALPAVTQPVRPKFGVFRGTSRSDVRAFEKWSGAELDYVMDYSARDTWAEIADPQYMLDEWQGSGYRPVYAVAMLPTTGSATLQAGARGEYDRYYRQLARNLVNADQEDAILRVGWEFNVSISRWKAQDAATFKAYWRSIVAAMRSVDGQEFEFDWNVNASNTPIDASRYWPGDDVVDYVGVDVYDLGWEPGTYPYPDPCDAACRLAHQQAAWDEIFGGSRGLAFWSDFAKAHGKPMSLPEWGLWKREDGHGGGDNPLFIERMHAFITDPANNVAYQGYFDANPSDGRGDVHALRSLGKGGAAFKKLFR
jgi:hypothetical protein